MMMNGIASSGAGVPGVLSSADLEVDKLYEPKQNKKIVRIFTVILYMFSVSLGAILLSLYYVFLWKNPHTMAIDNRDNLTTAEPGLASLVSPGGRSDLEEVSLDPGLPGLHGLEDPDYDGSAFTKQARGVPPAPPARDKAMTLVHNRHQMKGWKMRRL